MKADVRRARNRAVLVDFLVYFDTFENKHFAFVIQPMFARHVLLELQVKLDHKFGIGKVFAYCMQ